jgi:hypothetical protein
MQHSSRSPARRIALFGLSALLVTGAGAAIVLQEPQVLVAALLALASLAAIAAVLARPRSRRQIASPPQTAALAEVVPAPRAPAKPVAPPVAIPSLPHAPETRMILPPLGPLFVGREQELDELVAALRRARGPMATAIVGPAGAGKHTLVMRAIELLRAEGRFADGVSWHAGSELHGDPGLRHVLIEALDRFGGAPVAMTSTLRMGEAAVADLIRGKQILFWLDDIPVDFPLGRALATLTSRDASGEGPVLVLTSRTDWAMPEIHEIPLELPALDEAFDLWREWLDLSGRSLESEEHEAAKAICINLSSLPLAVRLAAGYAAQSGARLPKLAGDLGAAVYPPGDVVRTAERTIAFVAAALFPQARRTLAALSAFDAPIFDLDAACAVATVVAGSSAAATREDLASLARLGLIESNADGTIPRLRLHPLVRQHAAGMLDALGPDVASAARVALISIQHARRLAAAEEEIGATA